MSASHRKISRLPLSVFEDLVTRPPLEDHDSDPELLKSAICHRLQRFRVRNTGRSSDKRNRGEGIGISSPTTKTRSITTVGQLLLLSKYTLMLTLDPILTYEEVGILLYRVCDRCAPKPSSVLRLLRATTAANTTDVDTGGNDGDGKDSRMNSGQAREGQQQRSDDTDPVSFGTRMRELPTSLLSIDRILRGGIRLATITELVGRSGVGKTQLCFQLCITAAKFNQGAIYIDTEKKLSLERLGEMSEHRKMHSLKEERERRLDPSENEDTNYSKCDGSRDEDAIGTYKPGEVVLDNLTVHQPGNSEELLHVLDELEYEILIRNQTAGQAFSNPGASRGNDGGTDGNRVVRGKYPVRLLIVDSIAAPIRRTFGSGSAPQRAATIFQCAQKLKRLADQLHMAVVVINQAGGGTNGSSVPDRSLGTDTDKNSGPSGSSLEPHQPVSVRAALGTSWHHCVSTRLSMDVSTVDAVLPNDSEFDSDNYEDDSYFRQTAETAPRVVRNIAVVKSNKTGFGETIFKITGMGVVEA